MTDDTCRISSSPLLLTLAGSGIGILIVCLGVWTLGGIGGGRPVCRLTLGARVIASRRGSCDGAIFSAVRARGVALGVAQGVALLDVAGLPVRIAGLRVQCRAATATGTTTARVLAASEAAAHKAHH